MPMLRPLFFHDPADPMLYTVDDAFLLGPDLLAAPVVTEGATARNVYLPAGQWRDAWTGAAYAGPALLTDFPAPCPGLPLFIRQDGAWTDALTAIFADHAPRIAHGSVPSGVTTATYRAALARTI
jgi:alpha-glucosidase (family GH31 glycosyl hydrolase)